MNTKKLYKYLSLLLIFSIAGSFAICQISHPKLNFKRFTLNSVKQKIMIDWEMDSDFSANYFEIQRSVDGENFKTIALVLGPDPKVSSGHSYEGFDKPRSDIKKYYYRLKHVDVSGEIKMSEIKMLAIN